MTTPTSRWICQTMLSLWTTRPQTTSTRLKTHESVQPHVVSDRTLAGLLCSRFETPASASGQLNDDDGDATLMMRKSVSRQSHQPRRNEVGGTRHRVQRSGACIHSRSSDATSTSGRRGVLMDTHYIHLTRTPHEHHKERTSRPHDHDTSNTPTRVGALTCHPVRAHPGVQQGPMISGDCARQQDLGHRRLRAVSSRTRRAHESPHSHHHNSTPTTTATQSR